MQILLRIALVLLLLFCSATCLKYVKLVNKADAEAVCLDGSPAFIYAPENGNKTASGLIVYFASTPTPLFCGDTSLSSSLDSCILAQSEIASYWKDQMDITSGLLSDEKYASWGKVIIPNCDGSLYQGYSKNTVKYKSKQLYFRGNRIVKSNLDYIATKLFNVSKLNNIVFAGSDFGAVGALIWSRYFYEEIVLKAGSGHRFSLVVDSFPFSYRSFKSSSNRYDQSLQNLAKLVNVEELSPILLCNLRNQGAEWKCLNFETSYPYLNFKVMWIDSQYDLLSLNSILEIGCVNKTTGSLSGCSAGQRQYIEGYRDYKQLFSYRLVNFRDNSAWSISCATNSYLNSGLYDNGDYRAGATIYSEGSTVSEAVGSFINNDRTTSFDNLGWPANGKCSGS